MVWFQCEDCGENLKKPKLPNHFRICSAFKLSCIDCGETFSQQSVQSHNQCISEAEKYGPKDQGKASCNPQTKPDKPKQNADVDVNVGLSSRAPWYCSLCNTTTTSKQTLLLHADGKKHRAKARAYHAAQNQSSQAVEPSSNEKGSVGETPMVDSVGANGFKKADKSKEGDTLKDTGALATGGEKESMTGKKRKVDAFGWGLSKTTEDKNLCNLSNGEVLQKEQEDGPCYQPKKKKHVDAPSNHKGPEDKHSKLASKHKIKWKKLVTSTLKLNPDGIMKIRKLQKLVFKALQESGINEDETQLRDTLMDKINSSSRFVIEDKHIRLVAKAEAA
ncbi:UBP1-associated proteins 1C [Phoenix dactylifera]|uniref:UBP1-associated proteins 1C n=1 Tax=Phoenix dactylifera TaxID=42345 RepID=A0A8B9A3G3_PHODC|nr:UBP1-associated proteins 1C [Phoenix dactylifera]XP_038981168.1 UBP1-associated proteins 1C [Phoenix dactylifera]